MLSLPPSLLIFLLIYCHTRLETLFFFMTTIPICCVHYLITTSYFFVVFVCIFQKSCTFCLAASYYKIYNINKFIRFKTAVIKGRVYPYISYLIWSDFGWLQFSLLWLRISQVVLTDVQKPCKLTLAQTIELVTSRST